MLLAAEVGNSNTLFGLFSADANTLLTHWRLSTDRDRMADDWLALLAALCQTAGYRISELSAMVLSSVVPPVTTALTDLATQQLGVEPLVIAPTLDLGIALAVEEPNLLGADRLVDAIAAHAKYGGPAIIVDLGTATTIDAIAANGDFLGGAIATGVGTSLKALAANASQLFNIELALPDFTLGKNTIDQLRIGIVLGHLALLEGLITRMQRELGGSPAPVILTGGLAPLFAGKSPLFTYHDPELTLDGMAMIYRRLRLAEAVPVAAIER